MQRDEITARIDALWPVGDHTWTRDGDEIINEFGVAVMRLTDDASSEAVAELITHSVGDLRWALSEIGRLEAAVVFLCERYIADAGDPRNADEHAPGFSETFRHLRANTTTHPDACPRCARITFSSIIEEVEQ